MLPYATSILNFGFLGLSLLMLYLGYDLIKKVVGSGEKVPNSTSDLIKIYMKTSLLFMVLAGPLQWATMGIKYLVEEKKVNLKVGLSTTEEWEKAIGQIYIRKNGKYLPITAAAVSKEFKDNDEILLNVGEVLHAIATMRKQIDELNNQKLDQNTRDTLSEG